MFNREKVRLNPLHRAVIEGNTQLIAQLKDLDWRYQPERNGFNPLELAQLLGQRQSQELLLDRPLSILNVQLKDKESLTALDITDFEKTFKMIYRPFLTVPSYQILEELIRNCPYFFRLESLFGNDSKQEAAYQEQLSIGAFADTFVKWVNPQLGYGLFAAVDLPEKTFIGEYTGLVRQVDRNHPNLNGYCFHYPTRFWSTNYFVIDSLHEGNLARFINHSNQPNLQPLWLLNRKVLHLVFIANQLIHKGTELTFNYGSDYWLHRKTG